MKSSIDPQGAIYHDPPSADELGARVKRMCDFANEKTPGRFIPPVIRAIILHFWLAYDHPFVDGNGRTARALFYWYMLRHGFWLLEFVSISSILVKAPAQYIRSFLYNETDDNDLNYFIIYQSNVLHRAIRELHDYLDRKQREVRLIEDRLQYLRQLNHRQQSLLLYALRHPYEDYTIKSHQRSHRIAYGTARSDLLELSDFGLLSKGQRGKAMVFRAISGLDERLKRLSNVNSLT